jgi:membrane protein
MTNASYPRRAGFFRERRRIGFAVWHQLREADVQILAGSLAFATVMSLVPLLAVGLAVFSAFRGFEPLMNKLEPFLLRNLVDASGANFAHEIRAAIARVHAGALGIGGVGGLLITSTKIFRDMETAVQRVWRLKSRHSLARRLAIAWALIFIAPVILAVALVTLTSRDLGLIQLLPRGTITDLLEFISLVILYKLVPSCRVHWRSAFISGLVATIALILAHMFYAQLTIHTLRYNKIYGSVASIPIFLLWLLVLWWIVLIGVGLCAVIEREYSSRNRAKALANFDT